MYSFSAHICALLAATALLSGCVHVDHPSTPASLGFQSTLSIAESLLDKPGPIEHEYVNSADWVVPLSGLLNLDHPKAKAASLKNRGEPIEVGLHRLSHPSFGEIWVDTGLSQRVFENPGDFAIGPLVRRVMNFGALSPRQTTESLVSQHGAPDMVLITHLHLDHLFGLPGIPVSTPVLAGPTEIDQRGWEGAALQPTFNRLFAARPAVQYLQFAEGNSDGIAGVMDLLGDGSLFALWTPGHTPGHLSFLVRSTTGPILITGDASHTVWGWNNGVEPGSFSVNKGRSASALKDLRDLVDRHASIDVYTGHQHLANSEQ